MFPKKTSERHPDGDQKDRRFRAKERDRSDRKAEERGPILWCFVPARFQPHDRKEKRRGTGSKANEQAKRESAGADGQAFGEQNGVVVRGERAKRRNPKPRSENGSFVNRACDILEKI